MFENKDVRWNLTQLNMTSIFVHNWSHRHEHFLLLMTCLNETEKWFVRCIKGDVNTLLFIFWVFEFLFDDFEIDVGDRKFRTPTFVTNIDGID